MNATNKQYVVMKQTDNGLRCVGRYDPLHCDMIYAYNSRTWAEKYAARVGGSVFSVQGFINTAYRGTIEWHWNIMLEAERAFN